MKRQPENIVKNILQVLHESETEMSAYEISKITGYNNTTVLKYLNMIYYIQRYEKIIMIPKLFGRLPDLSYRYKWKIV